MSPLDRRTFMSILFGSAVGVGFAPQLWAQEAALDRGFVVALKPYTTGGEVARQLHVWEMEVQMKPMRMIMNPVPGKKEPQQVWYLAFRALPRPIIKNIVGADTDPVNALDPPPGPAMFIPQLTLVTYEDRETEIPVEIHVDRVLPSAVKNINVDLRRGHLERCRSQK